MVEQTTTVSNKLSDDSDALAHLVAAFELGDAATKRFAPPPPTLRRATSAAAPPRRQAASGRRA